MAANTYTHLQLTDGMLRQLDEYAHRQRLGPTGKAATGLVRRNLAKDGRFTINTEIARYLVDKARAEGWL